MNQKSKRLTYLVATGLLSALMLFSSGMYIFNHEMVVDTFTKLGFPSFVIYPLATAKILGLVAIWSNKSKTLKEWAYAGFFFDFVLAAAAHININDGEFGAAVFAMVLLLVSYNFNDK